MNSERFRFRESTQEDKKSRKPISTGFLLFEPLPPRHAAKRSPDNSVRIKRHWFHNSKRQPFKHLWFVKRIPTFLSACRISKQQNNTNEPIDQIDVLFSCFLESKNSP